MPQPVVAEVGIPPRLEDDEASAGTNMTADSTDSDATAPTRGPICFLIRP